MNQVFNLGALQWIETEFRFVGAFSLRPSNATATSGRSLLLPTPYAIKMALLDQFISWQGFGLASKYFANIRDLKISIEPPQIVVVSQMTRHIHRFDDELNKWKGNILNQQYCFYSNPIRFCFGTEDSNFVEILAQLLIGLEYLGQRGGFIQNLGVIKAVDSPTTNFVDLQQAADIRKLSLGIVQRMDDMQLTTTIDDVSRFGTGKPKLASRRQYDILLPYGLETSKYNDAVYQRNA